jgi:DNA-directed RNA polymerase subunit RPC12/RpoP
MVRGNTTDDGAGAVIGIVFLVIAVIGGLITGGFKRDPSKWYGGMACLRCGYNWQARRNTPPGRCPRCSSNRLNQQMG